MSDGQVMVTAARGLNDQLQGFHAQDRDAVASSEEYWTEKGGVTAARNAGQRGAGLRPRGALDFVKRNLTEHVSQEKKRGFKSNPGGREHIQDATFSNSYVEAHLDHI